MNYQGCDAVMVTPPAVLDLEEVIRQWCADRIAKPQGDGKRYRLSVTFNPEAQARLALAVKAKRREGKSETEAINEIVNECVLAAFPAREAKILPSREEPCPRQFYAFELKTFNHHS